MSTAAVTVRYDGPALAGHRMDIADIAPALLGISELCKLANKKINGDRASVQVLIGTDTEHQCFEINLHVVQTIWDATKSILANENVSTAKNLLEWLGLVGIPTGGVVGLFRLLKLLKGRRIASTTTIEAKDGRDLVRVTIEGDNNTVIVVPEQTIELLRDENAVASVKKVVQPITKAGYESVEFEFDDDIVEKIDKDEASDIALIEASEIETTEKDQPQIINAWITVYSPVYDTKAKAPKWRFKFGDAHEYMDISETNIAELAILRGGAMIDDAYQVELELTQEHKPNGTITNHFKIRKVLNFRAARLHYQSDAFKDHGNG